MSLREPHVEVEERIAVQRERDRELAPDELAALLQISQALSKHRDREALFSALAGATARVLPADRLMIAVPGPRDAALRIYAVTGEKVLETKRIPDDSMAAWVLANRQPMVVSSREQLRERFPTAHRHLVETGMHSVAMLPLLARNQCIGALGFMASAEDVWDGCPRRLLDEIASSVALALDNCLGYEQLQRFGQERAALLDVNVSVGRHLERDELFGALAVSLRDLLPTERFGIELPIEGDRLQGHLLTPRSGMTEPTRPTVLAAAGTACNWVLRNRRWLVASSRDELRERFPTTFEIMQQGRMESLCALPLVTGERCRGVLFFMAAEAGAYEHLQRGFLEQVAGAVAVALDDCLAHEEVRQLRDRLAAENVYLQEEIRQEHNFGDFVGESPEMKRMLSRIDAVAPTSSTVLILGETGTGKELVARAIHDRSPRRGRPLVKVNCSALPAGLVESELFGHVKGAFTGAVTNRSGRFELADGGTIFLDEIGELPADTQVRLLRVLQEREFEPVGTNRTVRVDVRVIAATNRHLEKAVAEGSFRQDLFYRLNVFPVQVPPLRERAGDVALLVHYFIERFAAKIGRKVTTVPPDAMARLTAYPWPGNVRELENVIERAVILSPGPELAPEALPVATASKAAPATHPAAHPAIEGGTLEAVERSHILAVLQRTNWRIDGPQGAARILNLHPSTLRSRMQKLNIRRTVEELS
jgi:formate hydrogenlyase transcriptional activator